MVLILPRDKHDIESAAALVVLGWEAVEPVAPQILEWTQDSNWPVAAVFHPLLIGAGARLAPFLNPIFEGDDDVWKYCLLVHVVRQSPELVTAMRSRLERLVNSPTTNEQLEGVSEQARDILASRL